MEKINLEKLTTEKRNGNTLDIDKVSTLEMVKKINDEDKKVAIAVERELPKIAEVIDEIVNRINKGGRIIYVGAGSSGRLGILDASECPPTYGVSEELVQAIIAGGKEAIFTGKEYEEDSKEASVEELKSKALNKNDVIVGVAASGITPYVVSALNYGNEIGALTISVVCNENTVMEKISKISIVTVVGPEVITGSTRLKAGTAQKLVLNMLSTGVMIKLGKVYENLMVDLQVTNEKSVERAKRIVCEATGVTREEAENTLKETNFQVKLAIFMILSKLNKDEAQKILDENRGYIAEALRDIQ